MALNGRTPLCDAPPFERHWLDRLFAAAGVTDHISVQDINAVKLKAISPRVLDLLSERLKLSTVAHRAEPNIAMPTRAA